MPSWRGPLARRTGGAAALGRGSVELPSNRTPLPDPPAWERGHLARCHRSRPIRPPSPLASADIPFPYAAGLPRPARFNTLRPMALLPSGPLTSIIELSISPVILISGVGALTITLTNRMARIVDRTRILAGQTRSSAGEERTHLASQLEILWRRAGLVRLAVTFAGCSMLTSCVLILGLFLGAFFGQEPGLPLATVFLLSILFLAASLIAFLRDIFASLRAVQLEVERARSS